MIDEHRFVDMEYVRNNPSKSWLKGILSYNNQLTVKDMYALVLPNSEGDWNWGNISEFINIREVRNNPDKPWSKLWLSCNLFLTVKDIETLILPNSKHNWDWYFISQYINIQEVINNPNKPWDKEGLERNKGCTRKMLEFFDAGLLKHLQMNTYTFRYHTDILIKCEY